MAIEDFILHKPPMRLVEELIDSDDSSVTTALLIRRESTFYDKTLQGVPAWVGLEYMAQTAGVWVGMDDVRQQRPVELGFLVSARQYQALRPVFPLGERFVVTITKEFGDGDIVVFSGTICAASGETYATANFTAYRPHDVHAYLRGEVG